MVYQLSRSEGAGHICEFVIYPQTAQIQVTIRKILNLNCGERYEDMIDHRIYTHNLSFNFKTAYVEGITAMINQMSFSPKYIRHSAWPLRVNEEMIRIELTVQPNLSKT